MEERPTELRLGVYSNVPEVYPNCFRFPERARTMGCPYPGWCIEMVTMVADYLNITITPVLLGNRMTTADWGNLMDDNQTWTGALGAIQSGEVDTVCLLFQSTTLRSLSFDFSTSLTTARSIFVTRLPKEEFGEYVAKVFRTFEVQLWALIFLLIVVQTLCMVVCYWLEASVMGVSVFRPFKHAWQTFRFFIVQPQGRYRRRTYGGNIMMSLCAIAALLSSSLYSGLLLTRLLDPIVTVPFTDTTAMFNAIASGKYRLITNYASNWFFEDLRLSNLSYFQKLRDAHSHSQIVVADSVAAALSLVESDNLIYPSQEDANTVFEAQKRCDLVFVNNSIGMQSMHFAFRKGFPLIETWNKGMIMMQTFIVKSFDKYMRDGGYMANPLRCNRSSTTTREGTALSMNDLMGAFLFFAGGIVLSVALIATEHVLCKTKVAHLIKVD